MEELRERLPWFDPDDPAHLGLVAEEQPEGGVDDGCPAIYMANGVLWYWRKEARPLKDGALVKTKAPAGWRKLLCDDPSQDELLVVEGEGHGMAVLTVGHKGVVVAGGVNNLLGDSEAAVKDRALMFRDKRVRLLFDPDEAGAAARVRVAREILAAGAAKVGLLEQPGEEDVEDWLAGFESRDAAYVALSNLLATVDWATEKKLDKAQAEADKAAREAEEVVQSVRVRVGTDPIPRLVVMTYERQRRRASLAVYAPTSEPAAPRYGDIDWAGVARGWTLASKWAHEGRTYLPDAAALNFLERGTLVLPPPPAEDPKPSEDMWLWCKDFMGRWVLTSDHNYTAATAYTFMTWRLEDCGFDQLPYLRVCGPSGSGKGRMLDVLQQVLWRSYAAAPTDKNLHRVVDYLGDITLIIDEFHLEGARKDAQKDLIDALCLGFDRSKGGVVRVVDGGRGRQAVPRHFNLFGPKVLAGYGADEDEALARRSVILRMRQQSAKTLPDDMNLLAYPEEFYTEAEQFRAHMLAWRARRLADGRPDPRNERVRELQRRVSHKVAQVFFPLVTMVPAGLPQEVENLMQVAEQRSADVSETRTMSDEAYLVQALVTCAEQKSCVTFSKAGATTYCVTASDIADRLGPRFDAGHVGRQLRQALGLHSKKRRVNGHQRRYLELRSDDTNLAEAIASYGLTWPPNGGQTTEDPGL